MAELIARFKPGQNVPVFCTAQVNAGHLIALAGGKSTNGDYQGAHATAGAVTFGVAERDSGPATDPANSWTRRVNVARGGSIARVVAGAAITATAEVGSDATGRAVTYASGYKVGQAITAAAAAGDIIEVALY